MPVNAAVELGVSEGPHEFTLTGVCILNGVKLLTPSADDSHQRQEPEGQSPSRTAPGTDSEQKENPRHSVLASSGQGMDGSVQGETEGPERGPRTEPQGVSAFRDAHPGRPEQGLRLGIPEEGEASEGPGSIPSVKPTEKPTLPQSLRENSPVSLYLTRSGISRARSNDRRSPHFRKSRVSTKAAASSTRANLPEMPARPHSRGPRR